MMDMSRKYISIFWVLCCIMLYSCQQKKDVFYDGLPQIQFSKHIANIEMSPKVKDIELKVELVYGQIEENLDFHIEVERISGSSELSLDTNIFRFEKGMYGLSIKIPVDYETIYDKTKWSLKLVSNNRESLTIAHRSTFELTVTPYDWTEDISGKYQLSFKDHYMKKHLYRVDVEYVRDQDNQFIRISDLPVWSFYGGPKKYPQRISFKINTIERNNVFMGIDQMLLGTYTSYKKWFMRRNYGDFYIEKTEVQSCVYDKSDQSILLSYRSFLTKGKKYELKGVTLKKEL
ncbi:hypothetical protein K5X82_12635 [Halosquirtibacter xylanolyticus]|uniref:hypothetical protein n=1 Tax=Halosquirtibacter xylanolyticus TaxID=3374599 RepID=UPI00374782CD|nr:hypothetical protein K5X82_12635 [Prolixibacteraceae bacterium]